ncbi:MAG: DUF433 domain-containing protein [Deltaproteobacteria bacterium]|nr:DUF433 domain-containing protein [Deltaproteobacteria bacterium]
MAFVFLDNLAAGISKDEILKSYPPLTSDDTDGLEARASYERQ